MRQYQEEENEEIVDTSWNVAYLPFKQSFNAFAGNGLWREHDAPAAAAASHFGRQIVKCCVHSSRADGADLDAKVVELIGQRAGKCFDVAF